MGRDEAPARNRNKRSRRVRGLDPREGPRELREMSLGAVEDLGVDLLREGELTAALYCLREAMERGTRDPEVRKAYVHAMVMLYSEVELEKAGAEIEALPGRDALPGPDTRETWEALVLLSAENLREWPEDVDNHLLHGMCLAQVGRHAEAIEAYEKGLALDPSDMGLKTLLRRAQQAQPR